MMFDIAKLEAEFLMETREDYVGLWSLVHRFKELGISDRNMQMELATKMLGPLLASEQIIAGQFLSKKFYKWNSGEALGLILEEWKNLGRDPDIGDIVWFVSKGA